MRVLLNKFVVSVFTLSLIFPLSIQSQINAQALNSSIWSQNLSFIDEGNVGAHVANQDPLCVSGEIKYRKALGPLKTLNFGFLGHDFDTESSSDAIPYSCISTNSKGLFAGDYFSSSGSPYHAMRLSNTRYGAEYLPAPAGDAVIERLFNPLRAAYTYSINYNILDGKVNYYNTGFLTFDIDWETRSSSDTIRYTNGDMVLFNGHRFSANGQYFVAQIDANTFVRVNTQTQEMTPFYRSLTTTARKAYAISGDGRYAFTDVDNKILIHDLSGCSETYPRGSWEKANTTAIPAGCT